MSDEQRHESLDLIAMIDKDFDFNLTYDEWQKFFTRNTKATDDQIKEVYNLGDLDGDNSLTMKEFCIASTLNSHSDQTTDSTGNDAPVSLL